MPLKKDHRTNSRDKIMGRHKNSNWIAVKEQLIEKKSVKREKRCPSAVASMTGQSSWWEKKLNCYRSLLSRKEESSHRVPSSTTSKVGWWPLFASSTDQLSHVFCIIVHSPQRNVWHRWDGAKRETEVHLQRPNDLLSGRPIDTESSALIYS